MSDGKLELEPDDADDLGPGGVDDGVNSNYCTGRKDCTCAECRDERSMLPKSEKSRLFEDVSKRDVKIDAKRLKEKPRRA